MDRDGNLYVTYAHTGLDEESPYYETPFFGLTGDAGLADYGGCGVIAKFPGLGGKYPLGGLKTGEAPDGKNQVLLHRGGSDSPGHIENAQWIYSGVAPAHTGCSCAHVRWDMDYYARLWIPANHLHSVVVLDANGNLVARIGRYGNLDDADPKCGKIHLIRPRAVGVSDEALYVVDEGNCRLFRAALSYAAEETVALP